MRTNFGRISLPITQFNYCPFEHTYNSCPTHATLTTANDTLINRYGELVKYASFPVLHLADANHERDSLITIMPIITFHAVLLTHARPLSKNFWALVKEK